MTESSNRREFLRLAGAAGGCTLAASCLPVLGAPPAVSVASDHFIPVDKKLDPQWIKSLAAKGQRTFYHGEELNTIGMPVGGIGCGQLYLGGDGRLLHWDIFNHVVNSGFGATNYRAGRKPASLVAQGFALQIASRGKTTLRTLDRVGFPNVRFCGEYPIGTVEYRDQDLPLAVTLEAFSPFIPLSASDSALPATVMHFTVKNTSNDPVEVTLAGWLENAVCCYSGADHPVNRRNQVMRHAGLTTLLGAAGQPRQDKQGGSGRPPSSELKDQPDFGTMGLAVLGLGADIVATAALPCAIIPPSARETPLKPPHAAKRQGKPGEGPKPAGRKVEWPSLHVTSSQWAEAMFGQEGLLKAASEAERPAGQVLCGAIGKKLALPAGGQAEVTFVVAWCFPNLQGGNNIKHLANRKRGHHYAVRFPDAAAVTHHVADNLDRLAGQTRLWHDTWYDSTLPHWLLDRLFSTTSTLATSTCQWWANSRFWAWEGVGCCEGTCGHVWNYAHAMARLFPELERSVREMQDYNPHVGFDPATGAIRNRGENDVWAGDGQSGYPLKVLREHHMSADSGFLKRLWPKVRKSIEFLIHEDREDGRLDGLLEGRQHNTYDIDFFGANTMVGSLYLGALRAGEEMAREVGDQEFAATCRKIFASGQKLSVDRLFNGEYFIQQVDLAQHPKHQYADGCLADQMFGQGWARQVGLGYLYPKKTVESALRSIWKYNWAPDIGPQDRAHPPQRWFATPGEAGLFTCTWPHSKHLGKDSVLYRDEIWTGSEYQVAGDMVWEGMLTEPLAICRAIHDRYHPSKRNPWNEVECGDHYARAMASYGMFLALCGFECHGPKGHFGFAPKLGAEDFRAAFTAAEGWGTIAQRREGKSQYNTIAVKSGRLALKTLALELPEVATMAKALVTLAGQAIVAEAVQDGRRVVISLQKPAIVERDGVLNVEISTLI